MPGSFGGVEQIGGTHAWLPSLYIGAPLLALAALGTPKLRFAIFAGGVARARVRGGRGGWPVVLGAPELHVATLAVLVAVHAGRGVDVVLASERRGVVALAGGAAVLALALGGIGALRASHRSARRSIAHSSTAGSP